MMRTRGVKVLVVAGAVCAVVLSGCSGTAGFPGSKDTQLTGVSTVTTATCESLFGKAADVGRALKVDKPDGYAWTRALTSATTPLTCDAAASPVTYAFSLYVNTKASTCGTTDMCGTPSNGFWVKMGFIKMNGKGGYDYLPMPDPAAGIAWMTTAATHVK